MGSCYPSKYDNKPGELTAVVVPCTPCFTHFTRGVELDYTYVPAFGQSGVLNAVRYLTCFALDVLAVGSVEEILTSELVTCLHWYDELPRILAGNGTASEGNEDLRQLKIDCNCLDALELTPFAHFLLWLLKPPVCRVIAKNAYLHRA